VADEISERLYAMAEKIGELSAHQMGVVNELHRMNETILRIQADNERKHEENRRDLRDKHEANLKIMAEHKNDDAENFGEIRDTISKWTGAYLGAAKIVSYAIIAASALWAMFTFFYKP
jgi:hypothetical protein